MPTKLLAIIAEAKTAARCLDLAERAAVAAGDATIEALHISVDPSHLAAPSEEIDFQLLRERREGTAAERAAAVHAELDNWLRSHPGAVVSPAWKQVSSGERDGICAEAKGFDVLVVARGTNADSAEAMQAAMYYAQRPFFLAPVTDIPADQSLIEQVVIAWNDTAACRRAVAGAMPWLRKSLKTALLLIKEGEQVGADLVAELKAAGVSFEVVAVGRDSEKLGDQIVTEAKQLGASLLVMGAHRHNALIEWAIGHTTDQVLRHRDVLLFLAH